MISHRDSSEANTCRERLSSWLMKKHGLKVGGCWAGDEFECLAVASTASLDPSVWKGTDAEALKNKRLLWKCFLGGGESRSELRAVEAA